MSAPDTVSIFDFDGARTRVVMIDGDPWWVTVDLAKALGYRDGSTAARMLRARDTRTHSVCTSAGPRIATVVSESGLYRLIMRSRRPDAEAFQDWITDEVIPAIRRSGSYSVAADPAAIPSHSDALRGWANEIDARALAEAQAAALKEPAAAWESLASADGDYSLRDAAHILNRDPAITTGQNRLMAWMRENKWVDTKGIPYASHTKWLCERARTYRHPRTEEATVGRPQVRVTGDGLARLRTVLVASVASDG